MAYYCQSNLFQCNHRGNQDLFVGIIVTFSSQIALGTFNDVNAGIIPPNVPKYPFKLLECPRYVIQINYTTTKLRTTPNIALKPRCLSKLRTSTLCQKYRRNIDCYIFMVRDCRILQGFNISSSEKIILNFYAIHVLSNVKIFTKTLQYNIKPFYL